MPSAPATVIDLTTLTTAQGFAIQGGVFDDRVGYSVSSAGDVNGDGIDDVIVGAPLAGNGGTRAGEAYVVYGSAGGLSNINLATLTAAQGFSIQGDAAGDNAGSSVSSAGDVNGDGIDDVIVGAQSGGNGGLNAGEAYVIYGRAGGLGNIDLTTLTAAQGFIIQGDTAGDSAGTSVSSAGDVNGDGIDDLIVGATGGDNGGDLAGEAYVIYGSTGGPGDIDLTTLTAAQGFIIQGDTAGDQAGRVSSAGDVNGDGIDDLIVGALSGDNGGVNAGEAYVIYGSAGGPGNIDLTTLTAAQGFIIQGDTAGDQAGWSVSSAGDVNGDGIKDVIVGAIFGDNGGTRAGEAYVVYGSAGGLANIDLTTLTTAQGFIIQGDAAGDQAGYGVSSAGDVNGDGFDDVIVGADRNDKGGFDAGAAYVVYGSAAGPGNIDVTTLTDAQGIILQGGLYSQAGFSVSAAGDVNGDGIDDMIVGAISGNTGGNYAGDAYVIYGERPTEAVVRVGSAADQTIFGGAFDDRLLGKGGNDRLDGGGGNDTLIGGHGNDILFGGVGMDRLKGGGGNDTASYLGATTGVTASLKTSASNTGDAAGDSYASIENLTGSAQNDHLEGNGHANKLFGDSGSDVLLGKGGNDMLFGGNGSDTLEGNKGSDDLFGGNQKDVLIGGNGADMLRGGNGGDTMTGGHGADTFMFKAAIESKVSGGGRDLITDFSGASGQGDQIDLSGFMAGGNFSTGGAFSNSTGEVIAQSQGADTLVLGDVDGDGNADFAVLLSGSVALSAGDFLF